jgi:hypothetical protein
LAARPASAAKHQRHEGEGGGEVTALPQQTFDVSYMASLARQTGQSRFRLRDEAGNEHVIRELVSGVGGEGPCAYSFGENPEHKNHLLWRCSAQIIDEIAYLYPPDDIIEDTYEIAQELPESHWRMCAAINAEKFRFRNERTGELIMVEGIKGWVNANWLDQGSHLFHDGRAVIDTEGYARTLA